MYDQLIDHVKKESPNCPEDELNLLLRFIRTRERPKKTVLVKEGYTCRFGALEHITELREYEEIHYEKLRAKFSPIARGVPQYYIGGTTPELFSRLRRKVMLTIS